MKTFKQQSGAVLAISLIMLLLLTIIGITGTQTASMEEKMASNMRDKNLAFQAAESAMRIIEANLQAQTAAGTLPTFDNAGTGGFYASTATAPNDAALASDSFWSSNPVATSSLSGMSSISAAPVYIVQVLPVACFKTGGVACTAAELRIPYKITVKATGGSANSSVILQSLYTP